MIVAEGVVSLSIKKAETVIKPKIWQAAWKKAGDPNGPLNTAKVQSFYLIGRKEHSFYIKFDNLN